MLRLAYSVGRIFIPVIFIVSGIQKFLNVGGVAKSLAASNIPIPVEIEPYLSGLSRYEATGYAIAVLEMACGLMILLGFLARWGALVLIVFTACTIVFVHNFWTMEGAAVAMHQTQALKNLSIMGGLLLVVAGGSHGAPVEGRRS
jgi:putative oxidoreductase